MKARALFATIAAASTICAAPLSAVGLGPLSREGNIDGPRKGFQLTLINPYSTTTEFRAYAVGLADETEQVRVQILPKVSRLAPGRSRQIIVIANDLQVSENYSFRVCAERVVPPTEMEVNARVCSKLTVHRLL